MPLATMSVTSPLQAVGAGTTVLPASGWLDISAQVAQGYNHYTCGVDTTAYTAADQIRIEIDFSPDGGATINFGGAIDTTGGPHVDRLGNPVFPSVDAALPAAGPAGLRVRFVVTVPRAGQVQGRATLNQL